MENQIFLMFCDEINFVASIKWKINLIKFDGSHRKLDRYESLRRLEKACLVSVVACALRKQFQIPTKNDSLLNRQGKTEKRKKLLSIQVAHTWLH